MTLSPFAWVHAQSLTRENQQSLPDGGEIIDATDPANPFPFDDLNSRDDGLLAPESLLLISADVSPTGQTVLLVGYEGVDGQGNGIGVYRIA